MPVSAVSAAARSPPNATGNVPIEDLAHALGEMGVATGVSIPALVEAAQVACAGVGRPVSSHIGRAGPRFVTAPGGT